MSVEMSELQPGCGEHEKGWEKGTGTERWLESFEARSPIRNAAEFAEQAIKRQAEIEENLTEGVLQIRHRVREFFGIGPKDMWVILGEQPCGLNEPLLVLAKRLLAAYMAKHHGWKAADYSAASDVVGSESGMYRVEVPYPYDESGIRSVNLVSRNKFNQSPASQIPASEVNLEEIARNLVTVYGQHSLGLHTILGQMFLAFEGNKSLAQAQNELLGRLLDRLGLNLGKREVDIDFDSQIARMGGLELILNHWDEIIAATNNHSLGDEKTRIPDREEAPFFAYLDVNVKKGVPVRPRIWFADGTRKRYIATHPFNKEKVLRKFTYDDIMRGDVCITFRAIPRVMLFALVCFDAHITGGGAGYNKIVSLVFPEIFGASYFPLAWMDLKNASGEIAGVFQYDSPALRKGKKGCGYEKAENLVRQGKVGMLDLAVSLQGHEANVVNQVLSQPNLSMSQRIDFTKN